MANLTFCGAAGTVTGSCSLLETGTTRFLVDCGLFQGNKTTVALNYEPFPFDPKEIEFLILSHAHIDHSGLIPKLVHHGFAGPIYATQATAELLEFLLKDGASIQESNTQRKNKKRRRRGLPDLHPLYTSADAEAALALVQAVAYEDWFSPKEGVEVRFWNAGHILGSASAELKLVDNEQEGHTLRILFSGDLGPDEKVFHPEPDAPEGFDYIVSESTYGNRQRAPYTLRERRKALKTELEEGLKGGGNVIIPSFAVERSQELLHDIGVMIEEGAFPQATVYLDSPLAKKVTKVFIKHAESLDDLGMDPSNLFKGEQFRLIESVEDSKKLNQVQAGAIIISASGMCDAGRIQHHLKANIWRPQSTILLVGYQSPGTLGSLIQQGVEEVRIHGETFKLRARVRRLSNYSAHADQAELVGWITERAPIAGALFLNHGEDEARASLKELLVERGIPAEKITAPGFDEQFTLVAGSAQSKGRAEKTRGPDAIPLVDWHEQYAAFSGQLLQTLEQVPNEQKEELLARLAGVLASSPKAG